MNEGYEKLKSIGAQKIHEQTHIAKHHIQAVLHESFDDINKIQLLGFISILEREYGVDLTQLKEKGLEYFNESIITPDDEAKLFVTPKPKKKSTKLYTVVAALIFIFVALFTIIPSLSTDSNSQRHKLDNSAIENAKNAIKSQDINSTNTDSNESAVLDIKEVEPLKTLKIKPNAELWVGYIDLQTHKKNQKIITQEFDLDPDKNWILSLGHGDLDFNVSGEIIEFRDARNIRVKYIDGNLTRIRYSEFKRLNKGNEW